jgi:hypothetical protein
LSGDRCGAASSDGSPPVVNVSNSFAFASPLASIGIGFSHAIFAGLRATPNARLKATSAAAMKFFMFFIFKDVTAAHVMM